MKRFICLVSLLCGWLLAGCGSGWFGLPLQGTVSPVPVGQGQPAASSQPAPTPGAATRIVTQPPPGPQTLVVWLPPQFDPQGKTTAGDLLKARLESFSSLYPGLKIEVH